MQIITQTQINAYEHCPRFYYLKYVRKLDWPVEIPSRDSIRRGSDFHLYIRQLLTGFRRDMLPVPDDDERMSTWLEHFCQARPLKDYVQVFAEKEVSALYTDVLWLGKFDALGIKGDRLTIFDWKTGEKKPEPSLYRQTPQTRLYRFLAKVCAPRLLGTGLHGLPAENIEMVYWFPEYPDQAIALRYSETEFAEDRTWLKLKSREMGSADESVYPRTEKSRNCIHCEYNTWCHSGSDADWGEEPEFPENDPAGDLTDEDIYQEGFFFPDISEDTDREEKSF